MKLTSRILKLIPRPKIWSSSFWPKSLLWESATKISRKSSSILGSKELSGRPSAPVRSLTTHLNCAALLAWLRQRPQAVSPTSLTKKVLCFLNKTAPQWARDLVPGRLVQTMAMSRAVLLLASAVATRLMISTSRLKTPPWKSLRVQMTFSERLVFLQLASNRLLKNPKRSSVRNLTSFSEVSYAKRAKSSITRERWQSVKMVSLTITTLTNLVSFRAQWI